MEAQKVTDPKKKVTDTVLLAELAGQGIDADYVEFTQDYGKRVKGKSSPYAKFYRDLRSGKRFAVISALPMADAAGNKVEIGWEQNDNKFVSKNNLFQATVKGNQVGIVIKNAQPDGIKENDKLTFSPQLFLDGKEITCAPPTSLPIDPQNEHYSGNVLEWDYGICKRRLRLIEGAILGSWVFSSNPDGEVEIRYNQSGDFNLRLGQFATDEDTETIPPDVFENPINYGLSDYPLDIQDSATLYSDADNYLYSYSPTTNCGTENRLVVGDLSPAGSIACRSLIRFDLSSIDPGAVVSDVTLSLYEFACEINTAPTSFTHYLNRILRNWVENQSTWNVYSTGNNWGTAGCGGSGTDYDADVSAQLTLDTTPANNYVDWTGATLIDDVQKFIDGSYSNYGWRLYSPDQEYRGSGYYSDTQFYAKEKGTGYKPKLVVTYTTGEIKTSSDSGGGSELTGERQIGAGEVGAGAETGFTAAEMAAGDTGSGAETGGLLKGLYSQDEGGGVDNFKVLTGKSGYDLKLHSHQGQVSIPHKEVRL